MLKRRLFLCLLAGLLLSSLGAQPTFAYEYAGQAWCCDTIFFRVNPTDPTLSCGGPVGPGWFKTLVDMAAATWNAQGTRFQLVDIGPSTIGCIPNPSPAVCVGPKDGQNTVSMSTNCTWTDNSIIAYSTWWYWTTGDSACCIYESDICFNRNVSWFDNVGACPGACYDLVSVALHELGHWIAANHEPDQAVLGYRPVMFPSFAFCEMRRVITPDDGALLNWVYDPAGVIALPDRCVVVHNHPPYLPPPTHVPCQGPCPPGPPFCDSIITDPCLLVCPKSDQIFRVIVKDSCGNPLCLPTSLWLDFSQCPARPCPGEEPAWPKVFPDSCRNGVHFFTVDAGMLQCTLCQAGLFVNGQLCRMIPARFFDTNGDLCVTAVDFINGICNDYNCNGIIDPGDQPIWAAHLGHCCPQGPCPPGPPFCDSTITDPCLLVCPKSDVIFRVIEKDSCGNLICNLTATWLDFSQCPAIPCPGEEPAWPRVYPDSCRNGVHYFTVDAGMLDCTQCQAGLFVNGQFCRVIPARFFDTNGDLCVTAVDFINGICNDYNCNGTIDPGDQPIWAAHLNHCCTCDCIPGDGNGDLTIDISDAVYLIAYIFGGGPQPTPYKICSGDANCDCTVDISDAVYLIAYIFGGGQSPCTCDRWLVNCGPPLR